ncbi:prepilin-type N-terminal cleavage/methylation domain-containing protein [Roseateles sp. SL47]|uniref:PilW family protein n=1 Tax=Roseateles sp. SL47 TaxID=2995138 RepID=UPI002270C315|nr:prepilin-type N-terminal cleavage/methylation domain-containing protein [Roseateles sp. SL47]WAC71834.1 prepilin-type N-terminal cleavage/methylation domain-containing protein [Roseateles sp. SL47]
MFNSPSHQDCAARARSWQSAPRAKPPLAARISASAGFTLIEFMVGLTIGLVVVAGALSWAGQSLAAQVRQRRSWQLHQELRAIASQLQMELRRAGAHGRPSQLVWRADRGASANPFTEISASGGGWSGASSGTSSSAGSSGGNLGSSGTLRLNRALDRDITQPDASTEVTFRWLDGRLDQTIGGRFQPWTDPALMQISGFSASVHRVPHPLGPPCAPAVETRTVQVLLQGQSTQDPKIQQQLGLSVHVRNDPAPIASPDPALAGGCP